MTCKEGLRGRRDFKGNWLTYSDISHKHNLFRYNFEYVFGRHLNFKICKEVCYYQWWGFVSIVLVLNKRFRRNSAHGRLPYVRDFRQRRISKFSYHPMYDQPWAWILLHQYRHLHQNWDSWLLSQSLPEII